MCIHGATSDLCSLYIMIAFCGPVFGVRLSQTVPAHIEPEEGKPFHSEGGRRPRRAFVFLWSFMLRVLNERVHSVECYRPHSRENL